jgi:hypothetical protein
VALGTGPAITHASGPQWGAARPNGVARGRDPEATLRVPRQRRKTRATGALAGSRRKCLSASTRRLQMWAGFDFSPCQRLTSHQTKVGVRLLLTEQGECIDNERVVR